ncbi:MAG: PhzF family phenazine biosynthesis protein [Halodesulfurarchaeum sp.]
MAEERPATEVALVDAFTAEPYAGNPAGVVPEASDLDPEAMQTIATEIGASETAFLRPGDEADRQIAYYTPTTRIELCGHATIASLVHLHRTDRLAAGAATLSTDVGTLDVEIEENGIAWMTQREPRVETVSLDHGLVADALDMDEAALREVEQDLPLAVADTGLPFLVVPVAFLEDLGHADPDFDRVDSLASEVEAAGIYAFTFDTLDAESAVHGRAFVPGAGVPEDPVTGTASGATGAYLRRFEAFDQFPEELVFEQGHYVDRPGRVRVQVGESVRVGGGAVSVLEGSIAIPPGDDEEILVG